MNSKQIRKRNIAMIATFVVGIGLNTAYGVYAFKKSQTIDFGTKEILISRMQGECSINLRKIGMDIDTKKGILISKSQELSDPYQTLAATSAAISQCTGFVLTDYCMGTDCDLSPVHFTLEAVTK